MPSKQAASNGNSALWLLCQHLIYVFKVPNLTILFRDGVMILSVLLKHQMSSWNPRNHGATDMRQSVLGWILGQQR